MIFGLWWAWLWYMKRNVQGLAVSKALAFKKADARSPVLGDYLPISLLVGVVAKLLLSVEVAQIYDSVMQFRNTFLQRKTPQLNANCDLLRKPSFMQGRNCEVSRWTW